MITKNYFDFFDLLAQNMNREWFNQNKDRYLKDVFEPFKKLTGEVLARMRKINPRINIDYKQAAFRIYRDTRFSHDKSPYKLWLGAAVSPGGRKNTRYPEIYFQFGHETNFIAGGLYRPDKETLMKIRFAIAENPDQWQKIKYSAGMLRFFPDGIRGERNKRLSERFLNEAAKQEPDIFNKNFFTYRSYSRRKILSRQNHLPEFIVQHYLAMEDFNRWLEKITG